jgi:hypothetical protein
MVIGETRFDWIERGRNMIFILSKCEMDKQHKNKRSSFSRSSLGIHLLSIVSKFGLLYIACDIYIQLNLNE